MRIVRVSPNRSMGKKKRRWAFSECHFLRNLVIRSLVKGAVCGKNRFCPVFCEGGSHTDGILLCDADIHILRSRLLPVFRSKAEAEGGRSG